MAQDLETLAAQVLDAAKAAGADAADMVAVDQAGVSMEIRHGQLEQAERAEGIDVSLRVFLGQRQASVSVSETSAATLTEMAERAVAMAREAPEDPYAGLASADQLARTWDIEALDLEDNGPEPSPAELAERSAEAEAAALKVDGVAQVDSTGASFARSQVHLATSNGFSAGYARTSHSTSCVAISGEGLGMERDYCGEGRIHGEDLPDAVSIGTLAGERAVARAGASKPPTGAYPVVFDERISSSLVGHVMGAINGAAIARGASWLKEAMGEPILPSGLSIIEDPHRARIPGSRPFDGEGLEVSPKAWVDRGVLTGWVLDLATGRKLGMPSTASAGRGGGGSPSPSVTNLALTQGSLTRDEMLREMGTGLLVTSMIGSTINPNTGDYSRGASGFWVENGEITRPVNECTIAGNLREMLMTLTPANDARTHLSRVVPSLRVEGLMIAGA